MNGGGRVKLLSSLCALVGAVIAWSAAPVAAQTVPAEPPLATSSNVHVLGHIPGSAAGMTFKDHYAFLSGWGGLTVLDIAQADSAQVDVLVLEVRQHAARGERPRD